MPTSFQSFSPGDLIEDTHVEQFIEPIQNLEAGKSWYGGSATGSANAFAVDLDPAPAAYTAGMIVHFKANNTVSGASTLNLNSLGSKALVKEGNTSLVSGDIVSDQLVAAVYDGTQFQLVSPVLNPTVTAPSSPAENVLVYAETTAKLTSGSQTDINLPSFVFDNTKSYLMEVYLMSGTGNANVRIILDDGTTSYAFPSSSTYINGRGYYGGYEVAAKLPTLSGSHTIKVNASYIGYVQVKIWEIYDNLVYADFSPAFGGSISSASLDSFTATSGHRYKMTMTARSSNGIASASCYLDNGTVTTGIPQSGPTTQEVDSGYYDGDINVSRVLTGLSGSYSVTVRGLNALAITVRIYDIT